RVIQMKHHRVQKSYDCKMRFLNVSPVVADRHGRSLYFVQCCLDPLPEGFTVPDMLPSRLQTNDTGQQTFVQKPEIFEGTRSRAYPVHILCALVLRIRVSYHRPWSITLHLHAALCKPADER